MSNVIALVWDFDKTLIPGYMQSPLFQDYGVDEKTFWNEVNALPDKYRKEQGIRVNSDTIYLNHILTYVKSGKFNGLNNQKLKEYGGRLHFYDGVPEVFLALKEIVETQPVYAEHDIKVEHYIVSTGLAQIIRGSAVMEHMTEIWGCEFIETENEDGSREISEIAYTMDNTSKTRALFEINKGVGKQDGVEVNTALPEEQRRVHFINMVYVADGPSDIPAFSLINQRRGATFAVYPRGDINAMHQVESMRKSGRINMFAEADYKHDSTAFMWLCEKVREFADRICDEDKARLREFTAIGVPMHLL